MGRWLPFGSSMVGLKVRKKVRTVQPSIFGSEHGTAVFGRICPSLSARNFWLSSRSSPESLVTTSTRPKQASRPPPSNETSPLRQDLAANVVPHLESLFEQQLHSSAGAAVFLHDTTNHLTIRLQINDEKCACRVYWSNLVAKPDIQIYMCTTTPCSDILPIT